MLTLITIYSRDGSLGFSIYENDGFVHHESDRNFEYRPFVGNS